MIFPAKKENVHSDAVENEVVVVVLICPTVSISALFRNICVAKNATKTGSQCRHRSS